MGAVKNMMIDLEEKCWDEAASIIGECEYISEAMIEAVNIFKREGLIGYLDTDTIEEGVSEMWNDYWSDYA
jgi:hypothetical protein